MSRKTSLKQADSALRKVALAFPETYEEFPWGERAVKVKGKVFVFMHLAEETFSLSMKLPQSGQGALMFPFAKPTAYGLGKSGWVSSRFQRGEEVPLELLGSWIEESYRAIAPKRLVREIDGSGSADARGRASQRMYESAAGNRSRKA